VPTDPVRLALILGGLLAIGPSIPTSAQLAVLIGIAGLLAVSAVTRRSVRIAAILLLLAGGILMRIAILDRTGSDVLYVTGAAISRVLQGANPYGVGYPQSSPPGASFPYGPVELLWYLPLHAKPVLMELGSAAVVAVVLALQGRLVGLAVYSMAAFLITTATDGSNDTSLGLLILAAFMAAVRWPAVGGAILGLAAGFKLSALAFMPLYALWGGWRVAAALVAATLVAWAPVIAGWGIPSFIRSAEAANEVHRVPIWSLGVIIKDITGSRDLVPGIDQARFVLGAAVLTVSLALRRSLDWVILCGSAIYVVTLFAGNWSTFAYFAGLAPLICWRLDDWLGLPSRSLVSWPLRRRARATDPEAGDVADGTPKPGAVAA